MMLTKEQIERVQPLIQSVVVHQEELYSALNSLERELSAISGKTVEIDSTDALEYPESDQDVINLATDWINSAIEEL
jgi:hypothetical protein